MTDPTPVADAREALEWARSAISGLIAQQAMPDHSWADHEPRLVAALSALTPEVVRMADAAPQREAERREMVALIRRAAEDSTITTSDGPGCFYCDHEEHTADCPARAILARAEKEAGA